MNNGRPGEHGNRSEGRAGRWFRVSAGVILAATGVGKLLSAFGTASILRVTDPVFGMRFGHLLLLVGAVEVVVAGLCFARTLAGPRVAALVAGLASGFLAYRACLWLSGWRRPCGCLGQLTDVLGLSERTADRIAVVLLVYLLVGSYGILLRRLAEQRTRVTLLTQGQQPGTTQSQGRA